MRPTFLLLVLLATITASAQDAPGTGRITGLVTDAETGDPLIGANVYLPGLQRGAATDVDGRYAILEVQAGEHVIVVSYMGYRSTRDMTVVNKGDETLFSMTLENMGLDVYLCHAPWDYGMVQPGIYTARVVAYNRRRSVCYPDPVYSYTVSF